MNFTIPSAVTFPGGPVIIIPTYRPAECMSVRTANIPKNCARRKRSAVVQWRPIADRFVIIANISHRTIVSTFDIRLVHKMKRDQSDRKFFAKYATPKCILVVLQQRKTFWVLDKTHPRRVRHTKRIQPRRYFRSQLRIRFTDHVFIELCSSDLTTNDVRDKLTVIRESQPYRIFRTRCLGYLLRWLTHGQSSSHQRVGFR